MLCCGEETADSSAAGCKVSNGPNLLPFPLGEGWGKGLKLDTKAQTLTLSQKAQRERESAYPSRSPSRMW